MVSKGYLIQLRILVNIRYTCLFITLRHHKITQLAVILSEHHYLL